MILVTGSAMRRPGCGGIDQTGDLQELKDLAKQLVDLYFKQKAATAWAVEQATS